MSERTIAEIIGWEKHWEDNTYKGEDLGSFWRWDRPSGGLGPPNVDDILAWISSQPEFMYDNGMSCAITILGGRRSYSPDSGYVVVLEDRDGDELASDPQPTCLEALEQCVRILDTHRRENPDA